MSEELLRLIESDAPQAKINGRIAMLLSQTAETLNKVSSGFSNVTQSQDKRIQAQEERLNEHENKLTLWGHRFAYFLGISGSIMFLVNFLTLLPRIIELLRLHP